MGAVGEGQRQRETAPRIGRSPNAGYKTLLTPPCRGGRRREGWSRVLILPDDTCSLARAGSLNARILS